MNNIFSIIKTNFPYILDKAKKVGYSSFTESAAITWDGEKFHMWKHGNYYGSHKEE